VSQKKGTSVLLSITLANINRFSNFFHSVQSSLCVKYCCCSFNCIVVTVVNPNNKFEIYVDQTLIHSGSLLEDMTSVVVTVICICFCLPVSPNVVSVYRILHFIL